MYAHFSKVNIFTDSPYTKPTDIMSNPRNPPVTYQAILYSGYISSANLSRFPQLTKVNS